VPFCAPFLAEIDSKKIGTYIITEAGKSTGVHDKLYAIPQKMLQQPMRDQLIELIWAKDGKMLELTKYIVIRALLGPDAKIEEDEVLTLLQKSVMIGRIYNYYNNLFGKLANVPAVKLKDYIPDSSNPNVVKFVSPGGCHTERILNEDHFPKEWRDKIIGKIDAFLGI
jgi:hypothetical protein